MKKFLLIGMATLFLGIATACSAQPAPPREPLPETEASAAAGEQGDETAPHADPSAASSEGAQEENVYMGKVSDIVGNEVTLELGNIKLPPGSDGEGGEITVEPGGGASITVTSHDSAAAAAPAAEAEAGPDGEAEGEEGSRQTVIAAEGADGSIQYSVASGKDGGGLDLEYTGETKSIVIPAGAKIYDMTGGETTLDAVKKGSVLMIGTSGTGENEAVDSVTVMG